MSRKLFVIAPPKTGSTLLTRLLYQHPDIRGLHESWVLYPDADASLCNPESDKPLAHGFTREHAARWHERMKTPPVTDALREVLTEAWDLLGPAEVHADSWPLYYERLGVLKHTFPEALWLYLVRDPRAVYWSGHTFGDREIGGTVVDRMLHADAAFRRNNEDMDHAVVRYEGLVHDPETTLRALWEWLGLDPDKGWIEYDPDKDPTPRLWDWIPNATEYPDPSRTDRWREEMPEDMQAALGHTLRAFAERYGYEVPMGRGDIAREWASGAAISELPEGSEDALRQEFRLARSTVNDVLRWLKDSADALEDEAKTDLAKLSRGYNAGRYAGEGYGAVNAGLVLRHVHNMIIRRLV